ncbi:MAG: RIP metalloprotease RseP [Clostridia bacterium]|nr:RIP metalloprotease RseP [Clostridia bacterium]
MITSNLLSFASSLKTVGFVMGALLILMIMITVHEFGHYVVGKLFKFKINEFAIGMGPAIFKKKMKSGEDFSIRALPIGGFCAFEGEDDDGDDPNCFNNKKPWQRILVLVAGATMNYLLALLIIIISMSCYGQTVMGGGKFIEDSAYVGYTLQDDDLIVSIKEENGKHKTNIFIATDLVASLNHKKQGDIVLVDIIRDGKQIDNVPVKLRCDVECKNVTMVSDCYKALGIGSTMMLKVTESKWFKEGDYIKKLVDRGIDASETYHDFEEFLYTYEDFISVLEDKKAGDVVTFWVGRTGYEASVPVMVELDENWESVDKSSQSEVLAYFGINSFEYGYYTTAKYQKLGFFQTIGHAFGYSIRVGGMILKTLGQLLTGALGINAVGGTVTTIVTTTKIISYGFVYALEIAAMIGVNLAVFNLLPIPALDGSRIVFCLIEWVRGKPISRKIEGIIHGVGLIFILGFAILVDVLQFI